MGLIKPKKKRTPEQTRRRFWISAGLVLIMIAVCLIPSKKGKSSAPSMETVLKEMNSPLEALCEEAYGKDANVEVKEYPQRVALPGETARLRDETVQEIDVLESLMENGQTVSAARLQALRSQRDSLAAALENEPESEPFYVRRITVTLPGGKQVTGFQKTDSRLTGSVLERMMPLAQSGETATTEIENRLNNNQ